MNDVVIEFYDPRFEALKNVLNMHAITRNLLPEFSQRFIGQVLGFLHLLI